MKKFEINDFLANRKQDLVCEYYQIDEIKPVEEFEFVLGGHLAIKDPFTERVQILDESAETRDEDGNWIGTVRLVKKILNSGKLAERLIRLKADEELHFVVRNRRNGYSVRKLQIFGTVVFIMHSWNSELWMYDASGNRMDAHDIDLWLCDLMVSDPEEHIYEIDNETRILLTHESFDYNYRLRNLRCDEEGWFISDTGSGYRVEADDERRDLCADDSVALEKAKSRGIKFHADSPFCPIGLIYPHKPRS